MGENVIERFYPNQLNEDQLKKLADTREAIAALVKHLDAELPGGRCKSIVMTKLEEAAMFATKAISH